MIRQARGIRTRVWGMVWVAGLAACQGEPPAPELPRPAMVVHPQPAVAGMQVFSGEVKARHEPALAFRVGGKIARRLVDTGARVRQGQLLAELDPQDLRLQEDAARSEQVAAEAELVLARSEHERYAQMRERGLVSQSAFDAKETAHAAAQAKVRTAKAHVSVMRNQSDYARLVAPQDGIVSARLAEAGQVVAAGQTIFTLAVDGDREVAIAVPEAQIDHFSVGEPVALELWSRPGVRWAGRWRELSPSADPAARTYAARVAFESSDAPVELGQSARVYVVEAGAPSWTVPLSSVGGEAGDAFVWVLDPATSRVRRQTVEVAAWGERQAILSRGVEPDDWIVLGGVHLIHEGDALQPVDRDNRSIDLATPP